jgi:hypothetical protein
MRQGGKKKVVGGGGGMDTKISLSMPSLDEAPFF